MSASRRLLLMMLLALIGVSAQAADEAPADLYNEGNAHARAQEWGLAVLDYQRARLQAPNDPDVEANLRYVLDAAKVKTAVPSFFQRLTRVASPNTAAALGLLGLMGLGCSLIWLRPLPRVAVWLIGLPLMGFAVGHALGLRPLLHGAVVVGGPAAVQASPVPMADTVFTLPEATSVTILAERPDYLLVATELGSTGWVPRARVIPIVPGTPEAGVKRGANASGSSRQF